MGRDMHFVAEMHRLQQMLEYIRMSANDAGFDEEEVGKIELACEEALVNIISYAYAMKSDGDIEIRCEVPGKRTLQVIFSDSGPPFNPLTEDRAKTEGNVEEREVGGLGVYLMRTLMDDVNYESKDNRNVLTLIKGSTGL